MLRQVALVCFCHLSSLQNEKAWTVLVVSIQGSSLGRLSFASLFPHGLDADPDSATELA